MRLNQLDGLLAFWKVAEHHGFSAAAAALEVSPSALSQAIRHLEARLGVRLLDVRPLKIQFSALPSERYAKRPDAHRLRAPLAEAPAIR